MGKIRFKIKVADKCSCFDVSQKLEKKIPGAPEGQVPIQDKKNPIFIGVQR